MRRIKMIQDGGEIPQDILTFMLSSKILLAKIMI